jgi:hypothetical protein
LNPFAISWVNPSECSCFTYPGFCHRRTYSSHNPDFRLVFH